VEIERAQDTRQAPWSTARTAAKKPIGWFCQASRQNRRNEQYADKSGDRAVMICRAEPDIRK
jgi:hypothetical protein